MLLRRRTLITAALASVALAAPGAAAAATCPDADAYPGTPAFVAGAESTTLCLLNNERAAAGLAALRPGPAELRQPAIAYANDMVRRQFFGHVTPDGVQLLARLTSYTISAVWNVGENLAWGEASMGTPAAIVRAWMNSPGHRRNILDGSFKEIGIGIVAGAPKPVDSPAATYVTEFGSRSSDTAGSLPVVEEPTGSTAGERSVSPARKSTRKKRCRKVTRTVRRAGKRVKVKKTVCAAAKKSARR